MTEQQIAIAYAVLKRHGHLVDHKALGEAMQAALCQDTPTPQTESTGRPESSRVDIGGMYIGD
jgi:hypothetical protein